MFDNPQYFAAINIAHTLILGPLLLYTGWTLLKNNTLNETVKDLLPYIGAIIIAYHSIRVYNKVSELKEQDTAYGDMLKEYPIQVNLAHLLFIGPLVAWVGYKLSNGRAVTQLEKLLLVILGAAGTVFHGLKTYGNLF